MTEKIKYPRTPHLPYSPGASSDDKKLTQQQFESNFRSKFLVYSEKLDGENITMAQDWIHARSLDSLHHPSRDYLKSLWGRIRWMIPDGMRVHGEYLYAKHSIKYDQLPDYFVVFAVSWDNSGCEDEADAFLSVWDTEFWAESLGLPCARFLSVNIGFLERMSKSGIRSLYNSTGECEGFVVRNKEQFPVSEFSQNAAKFVRANHVQTDQHWMYSEIKRNRLLND